MKKRSLFFISIMAGMMVCSCSVSKEDFSCSSDGTIWFRNPDIYLRFDPNMVVAVYDPSEKAALNVLFLKYSSYTISNSQMGKFRRREIFR
jgi:hypothetical protein